MSGSTDASATSARAVWGLPRIVGLLLVALLGIVLVRSFLVRSYVIPSASMEPTLRVGDRILVDLLTYRTGEIRRGDVVVFDGSGTFVDPGGGEHMIVKRVIGLPGERVACCDAGGRVTVDGVPLEEPYLYPGDRPSEQPFEVVVPPGRVWVMGDHRSESADSRAHLGDPGGGTVALGRIVGRAEAVYWPWHRVGGLPDSTTDQSSRESP